MILDQFYFRVIKRSALLPEGSNFAVLREDDWDDWFQYSTMYDLYVYDNDGERTHIGAVKIGQFDMKDDQRRPDLPKTFDSLDKEFFSLGQGDDYYENLSNLQTDVQQHIVTALRDVVADPKLWKKAKQTKVSEVSLTRTVSAKSIKGQFKRLLSGGARLTAYNFTFSLPTRKNKVPLTAPIEFRVEPESNPPTNVHVLIGRNGVGKTRMLHQMTKALVSPKQAAAQSGTFTWNDQFDDDLQSPFSSVATVSFSAFDETELFPEQKISKKDVKYYYVGLRRNADDKPNHGRPKSPKALSNEFFDSITVCLQGPRAARWKRALEMLTADPIFSEAEVGNLADARSREHLKKRSEWLFQNLSSGHKIVLLTITRLVEVVEEKTLVLIDEPEAHLHPPLLSAFVRALSDLLSNRNGVAIIATHSPVVLQEVPKTCVWMLRRTGKEATAERPDCETFGENVGILTREVFRLEVAQTGFHRLLSEAVAQGRSFEEISDRFNEELGAEARAIVRALIAARDAEGAE